MISEHGAKIAAGKLGITVHEYRLHEAVREHWCPRCQQWLPESEFNRQRVGARRLTSRCRECNSEYWEQYSRGKLGLVIAQPSSTGSSEEGRTDG